MVIRNRCLILVIFIVLTGTIVYSFNLRNGLFWDDNDWIVNNPTVHAVSWANVKFWFTRNVLAGVGRIDNYYRPVLMFTFALNWMVSGPDSLTYHLVNDGLHIANAVLVFILILSILGSRRAAFISGLIFVVHPLHTEAVTYVAGRGDPLNVFFLLSAMLLFIYVEKHHTRIHYALRALSVILLGAALLSRETAIVFPLLAFMVYVLFLSEQFRRKAKLLILWQTVWGGFKATWLYFILVVTYGILRLTVLNFQNTLNFFATQNVYSENLMVRFYTFISTLPTYFRLVLVPTGLHMEREVALRLSFSDWSMWPVILVVVGLGIVLLVWMRKKNQRVVSVGSDNPRVVLFGVSWFFLAMIPMSGITPINAQIYEHWLYLPSIGILAVAGWYIDRLLIFAESRRQRLWKSLLVALLVVYGVWLSWLAVQRNILWGKPTEFYADILRYNPDSVRVNNNLGSRYFMQGDMAAAEKYYLHAIDVEDIFPQPHVNLGIILQDRGDISGAFEHYNRAIAIDSGFPNAYQRLAMLYGQLGNAVAATEVLEKLLEITPQDVRVYDNLVRAYIFRGMRVRAVETARIGLKYARTDKEREVFNTVLAQ